MATATGKKIVTTANYIASYVGAKILEKGGNAFDAAIAISAALSVVIPHTSGLGGDGFLLAKTPEGIIAYNSSGWAPKNLKAEKIGERDPNAVVVPGLVDLWYLLEDYITLSYDELLSPAISLAVNGFYIGKSLHHAILNTPKLNNEWASIFGDKRYGDFIRFRKLGRVLREISRDPRNFYEGKISEEIVDGLRKFNVPVEYSDFSEFHGEKSSLLKIRYKDYIVQEFPPNTQGITTLQILKMVELSKINEMPYNDIRRVNSHIKISTIAYEDRNKYVADPRFAKIPDYLLDDDYLAKRMIDEGIQLKLNDGDTTFFAVSDGENDVGFIQSLFYPFGSGIIVNDIVFNNRGFGFTEGNNKPEGRKRPLHTLSILYAEKNDSKESLIIGCAGGDLRPQIHSEVLEYYTDYSMEIDEAVNAPRFMYLGSKVIAEKRLGIPATQEDYYSKNVGIVQAIKNKNGKIIGVADPRSEGIVIPVH
ncbi:gamma-glutamyltransferase family protein [Acidianus sulfidivorans JP7]|uniref:Gamma-glutamyltransferase n=1 Tax=Acidianus sulfidivorans JP7 TaxID=619593 RepID=A0A2U9INF2_9CREN|nr:gamma-glutamyltransferase [Acidianus sulfidivorans]AWR97526.1 gamma-glutamyltransferase family protein [Acidianus sulfidivorans JP7]